MSGPLAPKLRHADHVGLAGDVARPAERRGRLDRDPRRRAQHGRPVGRVLALEQLPARHRHHGRRDSFAGKPLARRQRQLHLGAGGEDRDVAPLVARRPAGRRRARTGSRRCAPCAASAAPGGSAPAPTGPSAWRSASSQHSAVSTASAGRNTSMFGIARRLARCSTGWCVGPSSPSPIESWVATKITRWRISAASRSAGRQ